MDKFTLQLPLESDFLTTVRLTTGGLCSLAGLDVDFTEDYKVCVTESLLILKRNGHKRARLEFTVGKTLACLVLGSEAAGDIEENIEDEISYALLNALIEKVEFTKNAEGRVEKIAFEG